MKADTQVQHDVLAELNWEPSIHAEHIGVEVSDGVVTLAGRVGSYAEKWDAERVAQRVAGVRALAVELTVDLPGSGQRTDADIARSCESVLSWTSDVANKAVRIKVEKGWVTLSGTVDRGYQREAAASAIRYLTGVTGVSDEILVKPQLSSGKVKSDIEAALQRRARRHAKKISVEVNDGEVTLSGTVDSWSERDLAKHAAWGTPGVNRVVDKMAIVF